MRVYECENCHSVFILNGADPRIQSGDYSFLPGEDVICPMCRNDMILVNGEKETTDERRKN